MSNSRQVVDYSGRTVDLLLLKTILNVPAVGERVDVDVSNVSDEPRIVTGVEKLVQRFFVAFMNAIGSTKFMENHGTEIVTNVAKGLVYSRETLESSAAEANMIAARQIMMADEGLDTPDDEKLSNSEVIDLEFSRIKSMVRISIKLTTEAGSSYVYIIPVGVGVH